MVAQEEVDRGSGFECEASLMHIVNSGQPIISTMIQSQKQSWGQTVWRTP